MAAPPPPIYRHTRTERGARAVLNKHRSSQQPGFRPLRGTLPPQDEYVLRGYYFRGLKHSKFSLVESTASDLALQESLHFWEVPCAFATEEEAIASAYNFRSALETRTMTMEARIAWAEGKRKADAFVEELEVASSKVRRGLQFGEEPPKRRRAETNAAPASENRNMDIDDATSSDEDDEMSNCEKPVAFYQRTWDHLQPYIENNTCHELLRDTKLNMDAAKKIAHQLAFVTRKALAVQYYCHLQLVVR
jgi:hypothetical protein